MNIHNFTPKDRKNIAARVDAGEKQKDLAAEYGISTGYLSKIVKKERERELSDITVPQPIDLSDKTPDQLQNRYRTIHRELRRYHDDLQQRSLEADGLQQSIEAESAKADDVRDARWILAQKERLTGVQNTTRIAYEMARLYQEASAILQTVAKNGIAIPTGPSVLNGILPGSRK